MSVAASVKMMDRTSQLSVDAPDETHTNHHLRYFTNNEGIPLPDPEHSKNIGGIPLISDVHLLQKQQHFNRSKNLERMVHPCGSGAFGYFEATADVSDMTKADFLQRPGEKTPIFIRFSTVTLGREFPDEARSEYTEKRIPYRDMDGCLSFVPDPRGFAIKFYTQEGNYDIVSNSAIHKSRLRRGQISDTLF